MRSGFAKEKQALLTNERFLAFYHGGDLVCTTDNFLPVASAFAHPGVQ
jgi:hypothetical protein